MMGKQDKQIQMIFLDIDSIVPENHLLRKIKNCINFDFIYEKASPYYAKNGRKSIDPVVLVKMLLIATVYKGNIIKNLIMDCQSYTKYRPNETTGGIFVSWRRKEELPTGA